MFDFPKNPTDFLTRGEQVRAEIRQAKASQVPPESGWYPFESLGALSTVAELMAPVYDELSACAARLPVADIGCGDGDFSIVLARWGANVDAIDYASTNGNKMRGVELLSRYLNLPVRLHNLDLDSRFEFPRAEYGLTLLLGTLYHLKNPYYVLERLPFHTHWCVLSTRIAQVTPKLRSSIDKEPLAYLADGREIDNDATNYWIFSAAGLFRILQRTRWAIRGVKRIGCLTDSDPISPDADERVFVLLQSRVHYPNLTVLPLHGWHTPEQDSWCWTAKRFGLEVVLPLGGDVSEFAMSFNIPAALLVGRRIQVSCRINSELCGSVACHTPGPVEFRGTFPQFVSHEPILRLDFTVDSDFGTAAGDCRELGVCVPLLDSSCANTHRIPFRIL